MKRNPMTRMAYLQKLPVHEYKVDKAFVKGVMLDLSMPEPKVRAQ